MENPPINTLIKGPTTAWNVGGLLLHWPIRPCSLTSLPACLCLLSTTSFLHSASSNVPQASPVNVPSDTMLISVLVFFYGKPPQPGNSLTFLSCLSPQQAKWVLINSSWLLPSSCLLHWFTSLFLFFSCSSRFQVVAPVPCTHLRRSVSINLGSLSSLHHPPSFSFMLSLSPFLSLILLLCLSCTFCLPLPYLPHI